MQLHHDPDLAAVVEQAARETHTPGICAGILVEGKALVATVGVTSTADPLPIDADTLFMIGSTTKTFTATALMRLVDEGAVSLGDRVVEHLPDFALDDPEVAASVTLRQLLNHTGGWRGDVHPETGWGDEALAAAIRKLPEAPQEVPAGTIASYSNSGFMLAGHLVALRRDTTFEQALSDLVLQPLGLGSTYALPWEIANRRHAVGHLVQDGRAVAVRTYPMQRSTGPAGGLWSSLRDQLAYARYHLDGTTLGMPPLRDDTRKLMQEPTVSTRSTLDGIGLSWLLGHHGDARLVTHGGNVANVQTSAFVLVPEHQLAVVLMANTRHGLAVGEKVKGWALDRFLGIGPPPPLPLIPFNADELVGTYDIGPFAWVLTSDSGRLFLQTKMPDQSPEELRVAFEDDARELVAIDADVYAHADNPTAPVLDVRRSGDGAVEGIVHGMRYARRV